MEIEGASAVTLFGRSGDGHHAGVRLKLSTPTGAKHMHRSAYRPAVRLPLITRLLRDKPSERQPIRSLLLPPGA
jgi:hypothetical protein